MTVSIVPSTGTFTAWYALVARRAQRLGRAPPRRPRRARRARRAIPRTIVERITPELPFASIGAARWTSAASCAVVAAVERSSAATIACTVSVEVRPGVAVGHRVDVERVDPAAVPLDVPERGRASRRTVSRSITGRLPERPREAHALRALSTWTSTAVTGSPVCALDLVRHAGADHRGRPREVDPVVDDDVELEREPAVGLAHMDPAVVPAPREKAQRASPARLVDDAERLLDRAARDVRRSPPPSSSTRPCSVSRRTDHPLLHGASLSVSACLTGPSCADRSPPAA